ncbi:MAG: hypothetical protein DMG05_25555 [Acidobacteria bacterium]|nr:MAG: hypothetical protein DMG05_25555 [Acidobacteriota bacterium]
MMKQAGAFLLALALVTGVGVSAQMGPAEPQPQVQAGDQAKEKSVAKKYPPYPDVWGYELPWPAKDDRNVLFNVFSLPEGDYFVTYVKSLRKAKRKDGTCCDFKMTHAAFNFFSGQKRDLSGDELDAFGRANDKNRLQGELRKILFSDGSSIEQEGRGHNCYEPFPYSILRKNKDGVVSINKKLLYLLPNSRKVQINGGRCADPATTIDKKVEEVYARFMQIEDETFILYDTGGNFILRFDKELNTNYRLNNSIFLVDMERIEKIKEVQNYDPQATQDGISQYLLDLKRGVKQ